MALYSYGHIQLWPYIVMAEVTDGSSSSHWTADALLAVGGSLAFEQRLAVDLLHASLVRFFFVYRHRRRRVYCAGMDVPVLKRTASARRSF